MGTRLRLIRMNDRETECSEVSMHRILLFFMCVCAAWNSFGNPPSIRQRIEDAKFSLTPDFKCLALRSSKKYGAFHLQALAGLLHDRVGCYQSEPVHFPDTEWKDVVRLYLRIDRHAGAKLALEDCDGRFRLARKSEHGFMSDRSIFLGPDEDGLLFSYSYISNMFYTVFNPNGLQRRVVFHRVSDLDVFSGMPESILSDNRLGRIDPATRGTRKEEVEKKFARMRGVYVADNLPEAIREKGVKRLFMKINNYNNVWYLWDCGQGVVLRCPWDDFYDGMSTTHAFWGAYRFDGDDISFFREAPRLDDWSYVDWQGRRLAGAVEGREVDELCGRIEKGKKRFSELLPWWIKSEPIVFRRVNADELDRMRVRVETANGDEVQGADREKWLDMLDNMTYDFRPFPIR